MAHIAADADHQNDCAGFGGFILDLLCEVVDVLVLVGGSAD